MTRKNVLLSSFIFIFFAAESWKKSFVIGENMISGLPEIPYPVDPEVDQVSENMIQLYKHHRPKPPPFGRPPPQMIHAGLPQKLAAYPIPRSGYNHELLLNVTWMPSFGAKAREYSLEITSSVTQTADCDTPMCYEYNIPGNVIWYLVPSVTNPVSETCTIRPGCAYRVRLIAHPWDGHTAANTLVELAVSETCTIRPGCCVYRVRLIAHPWDGHTAANTIVELDECVSGVCSCAHASRLPVPSVTAATVSLHGEAAANVTWSLPPPQHPQTLPRHLDKAYYVVSIGKQMVSDAHPSPWFATTVSREIHTNGSVFTGDIPRATYIPIADSGSGNKVRNVLDVRWLARVNLVDSRGCIGPAGNATAYDPVIANKRHFGAYAAWAAFGGLIVLTMVVILAVSTRVIKRAIKAVRNPVDVQELTLRPVWLSMQLRT